MVFSSVEFLCFLLPVSLLIYTAVSYTTKSINALNVVMLVTSLLFYYWGGGAYTLVLLCVIFVNYILGLVIHHFDGRSRRAQKFALILGVLANLGILGYYKYIGFVATQLALLPSWAPKIDPTVYQVILPIGISFYIFQAMSYLIDVYRREAPYQGNILTFALYISMFPQLIAGPIVRYALVADQLNNRDPQPRRDLFSDGVTRFCIGLAKKVIIADTMAVVADAVYAIPGGDMSASTAWLGLIAYTFQIYFDFSGYSDMAIGLGMMFGFRFPENFNRPYAAVSITDFWRRWHMTLSSWFRDYVYIPLGGSRGSSARTYANLWIVFLLTGIWHGANWTFIVWGIYHGSWLIIERIFNIRAVEDNTHTVIRRALTFLIVCLGWNLFRADDLTHAGQIYHSLFFGGFSAPPDKIWGLVTNYFVAIFALAVALLLFSQFRSLREIAMNTTTWHGLAMRLGLVCVAFPYALMMLASGTFSAFIYYQF